MSQTARTPKKSIAAAIAAAQREKEEREKAQVANQPHRRGSLDTLAGTELGRFILREINASNSVTDDGDIHIYRREVHDACREYQTAWHGWCRAKGIPVPANLSYDFGPGGDEEDGKRIARLKERVDLAESALRGVGLAGYWAARALILFDIAPPQALSDPVRRALQRLHAAQYAAQQSSIRI